MGHNTEDIINVGSPDAMRNALLGMTRLLNQIIDVSLVSRSGTKPAPAYKGIRFKLGKNNTGGNLRVWLMATWARAGDLQENLMAMWGDAKSGRLPPVIPPAPPPPPTELPPVIIPTPPVVDLLVVRVYNIPLRLQIQDFQRDIAKRVAASLGYRLYTLEWNYYGDLQIEVSKEGSLTIGALVIAILGILGLVALFFSVSWAVVRFQEEKTLQEGLLNERNALEIINSPDATDEAKAYAQKVIDEQPTTGGNGGGGGKGLFGGGVAAAAVVAGILILGSGK